jgi:hypothetical protein
MVAAPTEAGMLKPCRLASAAAGHTPCLNASQTFYSTPDPVSCSANTVWWIEGKNQFLRGERSLSSRLWPRGVPPTTVGRQPLVPKSR